MMWDADGEVTGDAVQVGGEVVRYGSVVKTLANLRRNAALDLEAKRVHGTGAPRYALLASEASGA
jgi:hypothetical protein